MSDTSIEDLIARLASATEGSRELDLAIFNAMRREAQRPWRWTCDFKETVTNDQYGPGAPGNPVNSLEHFSTSVDDALTLFPDDLWWCLAKGKTRPGEPLYGARIVSGDAVLAEAETDAGAAVALCIAKLKMLNHG